MKTILVVLGLVIVVIVGYVKGDYYFIKDEQCPKCEGIGYYYVPMMGQQKCVPCGNTGKLTSSTLDMIPPEQRIPFEKQISARIQELGEE